MRIIWVLSKTINKILIILRGAIVTLIYKPKSFVKVLGRVYLDTPNITFGDNVILYPNVHIFGTGRVVLEDNVSLGDGTVICAAKNIIIGKNSMIAAQCYITDCNHGMHQGIPMRNQDMSVRITTIGNDVWLGCGVKVLAGTVIKDGAVIGAGTVVSGQVDNNSIFYSKREYVFKERK